MYIRILHSPLHEDGQWVGEKMCRPGERGWADGGTPRPLLANPRLSSTPTHNLAPSAIDLSDHSPSLHTRALIAPAKAVPRRRPPRIKHMQVRRKKEKNGCRPAVRSKPTPSPVTPSFLPPPLPWTPLAPRPTPFYQLSSLVVSGNMWVDQVSILSSMATGLDQWFCE